MNSHKMSAIFKGCLHWTIVVKTNWSFWDNCFLNRFHLKWKNVISKLSLNGKLTVASFKVVLVNYCIEFPTKRLHKISHVTAMLFSVLYFWLTFFLSVCFRCACFFYNFTMIAVCYLISFCKLFHPTKFYWSNCYHKLVYTLLIYTYIVSVNMHYIIW